MPPYRDAEANKSYQRSYQRKRNLEDKPSRPFPAELRTAMPLRNAHDILERLNAHLAAVEEDDSLPTISRARAARELLATALKALEITDLGGRLARLEELLKQRGVALPVPRPALPSPEGGAPEQVAGEVVEDASEAGETL